MDNKCPVCGKEFETNQPKTVCCSPECKKGLDEIKPYADGLKNLRNKSLI